ncbi:MAG: prolyl oligopeptidase family serine peptidase, partial [Planctomycetes bacterium]|nr:prolyl oligopeptidase family serine peptidase [Planctomycetota bacterium]
MRCSWALFYVVLSAAVLRADGPIDNQPDNVRRVPPPGVKVPDADAKELAVGLEELKKLIDVLKIKSTTKPESLALIPDVEVYYKAVHDALKYDEFFNVKDVAKDVANAKKLLQIGKERAEALAEGKHPWTTQTGVVVRGYRSKIDGSVQPYSVAIPKDYDFKKKIRLDFWCHGRGETLSELNFIQGASGGQFASDKMIVLNLYGRYCCANKLAGEIDCFEALAHAKQNYAIDENRLVMRGFSMGGAACWQFAVHYPSMWCAAAPGAGFSETADFLKVFQNEKVDPTWYEKKLWHMYDCTDYALNLYNLPTVAYSGEIDSQKQAADIMAKAMKREGLELVHIIGPKTGHSYEKAAKAEIIEKIDKIADKGRDPYPAKIKFVTYTLSYNESFWLSVHGLEQHWERAQVEGEIVDKNTITIKSKNVTELLINFGAKNNALAVTGAIKVEIDGQTIDTAKVDRTEGSFILLLNKADGKWMSSVQFSGDTKVVKKQHGLQGPIDDAFLDSFVMVKPTGKPLNEAMGKWCDTEMKHAAMHWRRQFRGEAPMKDDNDISDDDIRNSNLILWGDPSSNAVLKKIADKLPITWKDGKIVVGGETFDAGTHVPLLIYPNPLNPRKYVVLNSGFTFREYDYLNN